MMGRRRERGRGGDGNSFLPLALPPWCCVQSFVLLWAVAFHPTLPLYTALPARLGRRLVGDLFLQYLFVSIVIGSSPCIIFGAHVEPKKFSFLFYRHYCVCVYLFLPRG